MVGCVIDWTLVGQMLSGLGTVLGAAAVFYAAKQWTSQQKGEVRLAAAVDLFAAVYQVQHALDHVRSSDQWSGEVEQAEIDLKASNINYTTETKKMRLTAMIATNRLRFHEKTFNRIIEVRPKSKAVFGDKADNYCRKILEKIGNVQHNCGICMRFSFPESLKIIQSNPNGDEFATEIGELVAALESEFLDVLKA
jgi:hypothetical protein